MLPFPGFHDESLTMDGMKKNENSVDEISCSIISSTKYTETQFQTLLSKTLVWGGWVKMGWGEFWGIWGVLGNLGEEEADLLELMVYWLESLVDADDSIWPCATRLQKEKANKFWLISPPPLICWVVGDHFTFLNNFWTSLMKIFHFKKVE